MSILKEAADLINPPNINFAFVDSLYTITEKSLILVGLLSLSISYILFPVLGTSIILWNSLLLILLTYRLYFIILFKKDYTKYTLKIWYKNFTLGALLTAFLFGILGILTIPYDTNIEHHLFIIVLLLSLSSGASTSLAIDHRLSIQYSTIIILPLIVALMTYGTPTYWFISMVMLIYIGSKVLLTVQSLRQEQKIIQQKTQINKVQQALKEKQNLFYNFVQEAPMAIFSYNTELEIIDANSAFLQLSHSSRKEIIGLNIASLPDNRALHIMKNALDSGSQVYHGPYHSKKGLALWVEIICFPFNDEEGHIIGAIGIITDKTKEYTALKKLKFNAVHDHLTSLLNRRGLKEYMGTFIQQEKHQSSYSLLFYLDLNKFKYINDSLGHKAGDELLVSISNRLSRLTEQGFIISRLGGDEFIVLSPFVTEKICELDKISEACIHTIQEVFSKPFVLNGINLSMQTSIGIVMIEPKNLDIEEIIRHADIAMYQAKKNRNNYVSYYDLQLDKERKDLFVLQHDLSFAIQYDQLKLYLQPLASIQNDTLIAAECLVRWEHPKLGLLAPSNFIPTAIETGAISDITWWVIEEVCKEILKLKKKGLWNLRYISVNVDARQLLVNHFVDELLSILNKYHIKTNEIMIEITERSIIDNFEGTQDIITALKRKGIHCAIDDFGVGYSSLSYLKKLSFDTLKIDREFIKDIQYRPDDIILIRTILDIGRQFKYDIVVEGIEEVKQKELLLEIDQNLIYQGFLLDKPMSFERFIQKYLHK
jgi:diguanylate cyclase (GGDEF)-like protein/PAS domain S-box-containing protein